MLSSDKRLAALFSIKGKTALITGAGAGIGKSIAITMALAGGARVVINDLPGSKAHRELVEWLVSQGADAIAMDADVSDERQVLDALAKLEVDIGTPDILVNNAGITLPNTIDETGFDDWNRVLAVHLGGTFLFSKALLPKMMARKSGSIIQMSSVVGHQGALRGHVAYATAKSGLIGFTKTLARTAGPSGVRVNAIAPGIVDTEMLRATHGPEGIARLTESVPLGAVASPDDIASVALFLASDAARHITGATLDVNGGLLMR